MQVNKEINIEQLDKVSGGSVTPEMLEAYAKMKNEAGIEYQNWLIANPGASDKEKEDKYNECLNNAYNNLSATDKALVDSYCQQSAVFPDVFGK